MGRGACSGLAAHGLPRGYPMGSKSVPGFNTGNLVLPEVTKGARAGIMSGELLLQPKGDSASRQETESSKMSGTGTFIRQRGDGCTGALPRRECRATWGYLIAGERDLARRFPLRHRRLVRFGRRPNLLPSALPGAAFVGARDNQAALDLG
jgi:hypothetical protein